MFDWFDGPGLDRFGVFLFCLFFGMVCFDAGMTVMVIAMGG